MVNTEAEGFSDFLSGESEDAQCDLYRETCNEAYEDEDGCDGDLPDSCDEETEGEEDDEEF